jgi:lipopolysaccharide transport system ATP-binding protein
MSPTAGRVEHAGRVSAILSLGAGFHPDLSGAENIRIGCAVLGLSPAETEALTPGIVEFSELGTFIDRPVRTYSSGMQLRLGFSVATAVSPDILVVDEHLSVGDQHFRHKCMRRITDLRESGATLVFCSHDMYAVGELCNRVLWIRDGQPAMLAAAGPVLKAYQDYVRARDAETTTFAPSGTPTTTRKSEKAFLTSVTLGGDCRDGFIQTGQTLILNVAAQVTAAARRDGIHVGVVLTRNDAVWCYGTSTKIDGEHTGIYHLSDTDCGITFVVEKLPLLSGQYRVTVALLDARTSHPYDYWTDVCGFTVRHEGSEVGVMRVPHSWQPPR